MADMLHRASDHEANLPPERGELPASDLSARSFGMHSRAPEDLIGHPISNAGESVLPEQGRFEGKPAVALEEALQRVRGKGV